GRALARPSERSERFEPFVRPVGPDTVAAATQKEKADAAELERERGKLIVTVSGINQFLLIMPLSMRLTGDAMLRVKTKLGNFPGAA
ncbi:hypothetical protein, partial [Pseudomonas sp.]|uniref:hypothetical protein n=1 Tax=Pseudomonas sp. TaxID=306 RepID=UPI003BB5B864